MFDEETGKLLEYQHLSKHPRYRQVWQHSIANEFGRLEQGIRDIKGTDTIFFICKSKVPKHKKISYDRIVSEIHPQKAEKERTRLTVGGDRFDYDIPVTTETADITTVKVLVNSTISTPGARFCCFDIKNFYLGTPMTENEYIRLPIDIIPQEIIDHYKLKQVVDANGWVILEIQWGMYGLKQAGRLANDQLKEKLAIHGYQPSQTTAGLWKHDTRPVTFALIVDNFGVKYVGKENAEHLRNALKETYEKTEDWEGKLFSGITLDWDYENKRVNLSMPDYVQKALEKLHHSPPKRLQHAPSPYISPNFGKQVQAGMKPKEHTLTEEQEKESK